MDRAMKSLRRVQIKTPNPITDQDDSSEKTQINDVSRVRHQHQHQSPAKFTEDQEPFMGMKARRRASLHRDYKGDYLNVSSHPFLIKILEKQGVRQVFFADSILKFTASGKMKRRILIITDFAIYILDPEAHALKRKIALAAVERLYLSELSDNFFAIIVPSEYDCLMASTRKTEIVTVLVEVTKNNSDSELEVVFSNKFEYHAGAEVVKEAQFEEVEGGVRTSILRK